jgi:alkylhydroperoxidase family enzyme
MARKPKIAQAYGELQKAIAASLTIPTELRAMMFLIQSENNGCMYCQAHSASSLVKHPEISPEKLEALWDFETSDLFNDAERAGLRLALAASSHPNAVTDAEINGMKAHFTDDQVVEAVACLSMGSFLNTWNDSMATQLEEASATTAAETLGAKGWTLGKHA